MFLSISHSTFKAFQSPAGSPSSHVLLNILSCVLLCVDRKYRLTYLSAICPDRLNTRHLDYTLAKIYLQDTQNVTKKRNNNKGRPISRLEINSTLKRARHRLRQLTDFEEDPCFCATARIPQWSEGNVILNLDLSEGQLDATRLTKVYQNGGSTASRRTHYAPCKSAHGSRHAAGLCMSPLFYLSCTQANPYSHTVGSKCSACSCFRTVIWEGGHGERGGAR